MARYRDKETGRYASFEKWEASHGPGGRYVRVSSGRGGTSPTESKSGGTTPQEPPDSGRAGRGGGGGGRRGRDFEDYYDYLEPDFEFDLEEGEY